jgi:hypothetical protein
MYYLRRLSFDAIHRRLAMSAFNGPVKLTIFVL